MQIAQGMNEHRPRLVAAMVAIVVVGVGIIAIAYNAGDGGHDKAAASDSGSANADALTFWSAIEPSAAEVFYPSTFEELAGGSELWLVGEVVAASIVVAEPHSVIAIRPSRTLSADPVPTNALLAVTFGDLTWKRRSVRRSFLGSRGLAPGRVPKSGLQLAGQHSESRTVSSCRCSIRT
jgi:hypothetical protein